MNQGNSPSQTTTAQAPNWQQPYQSYGLKQALAQFQGVDSPQQLVAGFSQPQNQAISGIQQLATNNPTLGSTQAYLSNVLSGSPANNPYLNSEFNDAANSVQNRLESEFAGAGRNVIGSAPVQTDALNNLATQLYGGAYNTGIQQQENAAANAPNLVNSQMGLQQGLFGAGQQIQNLAQNYIQAPQNFLNQYLSQVNGDLGATQTQTLPLTTLQQIGLSGFGATQGGQLGSQLGSYLGGSSGSNLGGLLGSLAGAFL